MKKKILIIFVFIGLVFLIINTDFNEIYTSIGEVPKDVFIFLLLLQILTIILLAVQWRQVMHLINIKRSFISVLKMNLSGNIIDSITPGSKVGGEFARILYIRENLNIEKSKSIIIVIIQKLISIFSFIILSILSVLYLIFKYKGLNTKHYYFLLSILILVLISICLLISNSSIISNILYFFRKNSLKFKDKKTKNYIEVIEDINKFKLNKNILLGIIIWLIYALKLIVLTRVFNKEISILKLTAVTYISYLIGMIPLLPGSLGSFEFSMASMLIISGINREESLIIAIIFRFVTFWFEFIFSLFILGIEKIRKKKAKGGKYA